MASPSAVLELEELLRALPARPDPGRLLAGFVPPPRFRGKRFGEYRPDERHPSQAEAVQRLRAEAAALRRASTVGGRLRAALGGRRGGGVYLDGGFGVGKTHLLAALWHAAPAPRAYLSFDELMYTLGLLGVERTRAAFRGHRLVCVDEWELDDPGNLKLALAFLRGALADGVRVAATSNTVPDELGRGRFSQKSFTAEIEELAGAFEVVRIEGEDFRHRHFQADPGREHFVHGVALEGLARRGGRVVRVRFPALMAGLGRVHPVHYAALAERMDVLLVEGLEVLPSVAEGLRWVHLVDKLYDGAVGLAATSGVRLGELFPAGAVTGPFGKKFSRCLSRMEEMLAERR